MVGQIIKSVTGSVQRAGSFVREMFSGGPVLDAQTGKPVQGPLAHAMAFPRTLGLFLLLGIIVLGASMRGYCGDSDLTSLVTDAGTLWTSVKTFILGVVTFVLLLAVVKLIRKK